MKKRMIWFASILILALCVTGISCSHNSGANGLPTGNVKPGSSEDPFANSNWSMVQGNSAGKILSFYSGNKVSYGNNDLSTGMISMNGVYTVVKEGSAYTAYCKVSYQGESTIIKLELISSSSKSGRMYLEDVAYYTLYKL